MLHCIHESSSYTFMWQSLDELYDSFHSYNHQDHPHFYLSSHSFSISAYPTISIWVSTKLPVCASAVITSVHTLICDHQKWEEKQNNTVEKCFKNHWTGQLNVDLYSLSRNLTWTFEFGGFGDSSVGKNLVIQAWESGFRSAELI